MKRFLVTGAGGFIGKNLVRALRERPECEVVAAGRDFDLRSQAAARSLFSEHGRFDYILHAADVGGDVGWSKAHAGSQFLDNASMAVHVLEAWRAHQPDARLVGFSTLWAYPESLMEVREQDYWSGPMHAPVEHYGVVKKALGVGIAALRRQWGMKGTMLVLGNVYGPGDPSTRVIPSLVKRFRSNPDVLEVWGDGSQTRDFVYIDDQIEGVLRHLDCDVDLLNITTGEYHSIREVVHLLAELTGYGGRIVFLADKGAGVSSRSVSIERARAATGWPDNVRLHTLEEGLRKTLASGGGSQP
jgi:GDP-L-fucose synthase